MTLSAQFGQRSGVELVEGVRLNLDKKFNLVAPKDKPKQKTFAKMIMAMSKTYELILIKSWPDRTHNMDIGAYALNKPPVELRPRKTLEIYAPIAHRTSLSTI